VPSNEEIATVLETAADSYESEKVEWCAGSWRKPDPENPSKITACAEGAIYLAAGVGLEQLDVRLPDNLILADLSEQEMDQWPDYTPSTAWDLGEAAIAKLGAFVDVPERLRDWPLYSWNDDVGRTKEEVIEAMKACAKELRNDNE
jgi:hypothetical protein